MKLSEIVKPSRTSKKPIKLSPINNLSRKEFTKLSDSVFQLENVKARNEVEMLHPAKFPELLAERFIKTYTKKGYIVLDPFGGTGSTGIAAAWLKRKALLLEIGEKWCKIARERVIKYPSVKIIRADSIKYLKKLKKKKFRVDYTFTSPPYSRVLHNTYNDVDRMKKGLPKIFTDDPNDLGNMDYEQCLSAFVEIVDDIYDITNNHRYASFVLQNYLKKDIVEGKRKGSSYQHLFAWEAGVRIQKETRWRVLPEAIWYQDKRLLGFGFPKYFYHANHHHYVIHLLKDE